MKKAVIIGAGPAGMTAAYHLLKKNTDVVPVVIEAENFVGGIARTLNYNGNRMDIGGHRFFTKNDEIMSLWQEIMADEMLERNRISRILYRRKFFNYPISMSIQTFCNLGLISVLQIGMGYIWSTIHKRDEKTLADFMINRFGYPLYLTFFKDYTHKVWGRYPENIDANWGKQRIKGLSLKKAIMDNLRKVLGKKNSANTETSLIDKFSYPAYGPGEMWERMAEYIKNNGGEMLMNTTVIKINCDNQNNVISVTVNDGQKEYDIECDSLISSMAIKDLFNALNEVNAEAGKLAIKLPYRDFITVGVLIKRDSLNSAVDISKDTWIYVQEADVKMGRIQIFNNWSPYLVKNSEENLWLGLEYFCNEGDEMWNMSDDAFTEMALGELYKLRIVDRGSVIDNTCCHVKKAYPAYFDTYKDFPVIREYLDKIPNLYCIGRNGQHRYNNMDHSMLTAIKAVECILGNNVSKNDIWNVNTENEYHESR